MNFWELNITAGRFFLDFSWIGFLLVIAMVIRSRVPLFQKYLIPANLLGGAIGLIIGTNGFGWIDFSTERLGTYVYHLLALLFIALGLRTPQKELGRSSFNVGISFIITYLIQGILGLLIALLLIYTIMPNLFAGIGFLAPLAFGMNPGIAFTVGENWGGYGFDSGGVVGLTFSAIGFLAAYTTGVWFVKRGIREGRAAYIKPNEENSENADSGFTESSEPFAAGRVTTSAGVLESLSLHIGLVGLVYLATYGFMEIAATGLHLLGAEQEISTLWTFHFIFAAIIAIIMRQLLQKLDLAFFIDDTSMTRLSNLFMDFMIVASIAAISMVVVAAYWLPLLLISISAIFGTYLFLQYFCRISFQEYHLERFTAIYGNMTGTLQSGLLLLRLLDPKMESPVSYNLLYGSGLALLLGFPLLLLINAPVHYFENTTLGFIAVLAIMILYLFILTGAWYFSKERA